MSDAESQKIPSVTDSELKAKLREILEQWPLYREYVYTGSSEMLLPGEISMFCDSPKCGKEQLWENNTAGRFGHKIGWSTTDYKCRNCRTHTVYFLYYWGGGNDIERGRFLKAGQDPPLERDAPLRLRKKLDKVDVDLYRKALT